MTGKLGDRRESRNRRRLGRAASTPAAVSGWTCEPGQERYLAHLAASGVLDEADRVFDAIERGDDLGPIVTVDELIARIPDWPP